MCRPCAWKECSEHTKYRLRHYHLKKHGLFLTCNLYHKYMRYVLHNSFYSVTNRLFCLKSIWNRKKLKSLDILLWTSFTFSIILKDTEIREAKFARTLIAHNLEFVPRNVANTHSAERKYKHARSGISLWNTLRHNSDQTEKKEPLYRTEGWDENKRK